METSDCIVACAKAPRDARLAAYALAGAHGHEWSRLDHQVVEAGGPTLVEAWHRHASEQSETWLGGQPPSLAHTTGTGRLSWSCTPSGVRVTVSRPAGDVLQVFVPYRGTRIVVSVCEVGHVLYRHVEAACRAIAAFRPECVATLRTSLHSRVECQAYASDLWDERLRLVAWLRDEMSRSCTPEVQLAQLHALGER